LLWINIQKKLGRTILDKTQNGGVNQDGGFLLFNLRTVLFSEKTKFNKKNILWSQKSKMMARNQNGAKRVNFY
jgi:hypothetical protein